MKKNFVPLGILAVIIIVIVGYLILHKSPKVVTTTKTTSTTSSSAASSSTNSVIQTKSASSVGAYLADANGDALYTYGGDTPGVSNCTGSCLSAWPAYQVTSSSTSLPANVTIITRSDGTKQYAYKGLPLYTFTGDSAGEVTGNGVSDFHVAKP